jgi:polar amino acid transport system substrate-binding protein
VNKFIARIKEGCKSGSLAVQDMLNGNLSYAIIDEPPAQFIVKAFDALN